MDTPIERAAIRRDHIGENDVLEMPHRGVHDRHVGLDPILDPTPAHSTRSSTATNGPPATHASRSREPPSF